MFVLMERITMKQLIGSLVLVLLCASAIYAGPNARAKIVATLNRTSGFVTGDEVKLTVSIKGGVKGVHSRKVGR